jgi:hypothetical protein
MLAALTRLRPVAGRLDRATGPLEIGEKVPNYGRKLRPNFSPIARSEQFFAPLSPKVGDGGDAAGLPNRDLVSAIYARIWSAPKLIDVFARQEQRDLQPHIATTPCFLPIGSMRPLTPME